MAQKVELAKMLWQYNHDTACSALSVSEMQYERKRICEIAAVFECIIEHAMAIFEEDDAEGECHWEDGYSLLEWGWR